MEKPRRVTNIQQECLMLIRELMTRNIASTTPTTTLTDAARKMRDGNIGCLPVNDSGNFIGMLTEKDLTTRATAEGLNPTTTTVRQIMTTGVTYCHDTDSIEDALRTMEENHIHHLPVRLSGSNKVVGIVSLSDLALKGPQELYSNVSRLAFQSASLNNQANTARPLN
jgi:CBS domain-containing protein